MNGFKIDRWRVYKYSAHTYWIIKHNSKLLVSWEETRKREKMKVLIVLVVMVGFLYGIESKSKKNYVSITIE